MKTFLQKLGVTVHEKVTGAPAPTGFLSALGLLVGILTCSTFFYHYVEGWSYIDSLYFSVVTVTTVGYGDFHPTTDLSKLFTIFLVLFGAGLGVYIISTFAASLIEGRQRRSSLLHKILEKVTE